MKPHRRQYWLNANPQDPERFAQQVEVVCELYTQALELHQMGVHVVSTDEKTGIQALFAGSTIPTHATGTNPATRV